MKKNVDRKKSQVEVTMKEHRGVDEGSIFCMASLGSAASIRHISHC